MLPLVHFTFLQRAKFTCGLHRLPAGRLPNGNRSLFFTENVQAVLLKWGATVGGTPWGLEEGWGGVELPASRNLPHPFSLAGSRPSAPKLPPQFTGQCFFLQLLPFTLRVPVPLSRSSTPRTHHPASQFHLGIYPDASWKSPVSIFFKENCDDEI